MRKAVATTITAIAILTGCTTTHTTATDWTRGYQPCATEDSTGPCYWDATRQGNGKGRSFTVTADGKVHYR